MYNKSIAIGTVLFNILLDILRVISGTTFPAEHFTGAKTGFTQYSNCHEITT